MNTYEKIIAQREQRFPMIRYDIKCHAKTALGKKEIDDYIKKHAKDKLEMSTSYTFYYNDPTQSEAERKRIVEAFATYWVKDTLYGASSNRVVQGISRNDYKLDIKKTVLHENAVDPDSLLAHCLGNAEDGETDSYMIDRQQETKQKNLFNRLLDSFKR
ncbi:hypothetical protein [Enterococcus wangshanyuanii]|uniref:Large polyvalent protein associated domain-containing protein n=1 Tax=Enterococcus wangshanyuanii TaxID=2005703 RepID=A0ABQ1NEL1_9ENTE|nr:hypothetical protein [Enterococcus wangshanyuanii]GGC74628.1 hypothetical protein GCM10011573_00150 [Enterococcus wangshanyuanii]